MSQDGITVMVCANECKKLEGLKIEKIYQPSPMELVLGFRGDKKLFISAKPDKARVILTEKKIENPSSPPMFCMLLRKHLIGGKLLKISQVGTDRIISIDIECRDTLGNVAKKFLIVEMMGKTSNIIFIDEDGIIIDAIKRVYFPIITSEENKTQREILPKMPYLRITENEKLPFTEIGLEKFLEKINSPNFENLKNFLISGFEGIGPMTAKELLHRAKLDERSPIKSLTKEEKERLYKALDNLRTSLINNQLKPTVYVTEDTPPKIVACYPLELSMYEGVSKKTFSTVSEMLEEVYTEHELSENIKNRTANLKKLTKNIIKKLEKKLQKQKSELLEAKDRENLKIYADLLQANLNRPYRNEPFIVVKNYYDPELGEIEIPLDPKLSLVKNAQRYYKLYQKQKNRELLLSKEIPKVERELSYAEQIELSLEQITTLAEVVEIKEEMETQGYIKSEGKKNKTSSKSFPAVFKSSDGFIIMAGKNNVQNDNLTFREAKPQDLWFHIKDYAGSHVIIKTEGKEVPPKTLEEAAYIAKVYSKAKSLPHASVDYTAGKNVKRMKGAKLGMVNYYEFKTIYTSDDREISQRIEKIKGDRK